MAVSLGEDYEKFDAMGLADLVRTGQVHPKELVDCALARIEAHNAAVNAVVHTMIESARAQAMAPLPEGPFSGVPFLVKDLFAAVAGAPLTNACRVFTSFVPNEDSELIARYRQAGLIIVGKTNTPEFGILPVTESRLFGVARNPWNLAHTPGGSSGGAGAAVAAGMVPAAHGSDGGGSIRIPASCCGLFGMKPTRGRNPLGPKVGDALGGFLQEHVLTRSVRDSAAFLDATAGADGGAPYAAPPVERPFIDEVGRPPGRLRISWTAQSLFGASTHAHCRQAVEDAARLCADLGHHVEERCPAIDKAALVRAFIVVFAVEVSQAMRKAAGFARRSLKSDDFEPYTWVFGLIGNHVSGMQYRDAIETAYMAGRRLAQFFRECDVLLTPTLAHPPVAIGTFALSPGEERMIALLRRVPLPIVLDRILSRISDQAFEVTGNTMLFNMTGQPAASVPLFWNAAGLPIGIQLAARFGDEATLFRLAAQLEEARPWFHKRPPRR